MTETPRTRQGSTNCFDALRLLAALAVVVQHATAHLNDRFLWVDPYDPWWFYDGVPAFFILSGYFVYRSAANFAAKGHRWSDFLFNRALRVVPAIWTYLLVTLVLLVSLGIVSRFELLSADVAAWVASTLLMVPAYSPTALDHFGIGVINGSLWTIPVEVSFYVALPLVLVPLRKKMGARAFLLFLGAVSAVAVMAAALLGESLGGRLLGLTFLPHLGFFGLGIAWYGALRAWKPRLRHAKTGLVLYALVVWWRNGVDAQWHLPLTLLAAIPLSVVLMYAGENGPGWASTLTRRVGDLSYGAYIWHMPLINLMLWSEVTTRLPPATAPAIALVLTLIAARLSWRFVEEPMLRRKRHSSRTELSVAPPGGAPA